MPPLLVTSVGHPRARTLETVVHGKSRAGDASVNASLSAEWKSITKTGFALRMEEILGTTSS
jgi:hypothetical protein